MNSEIKKTFWTWSLLGAMAAVVILVIQTVTVGGIEGLIQVGEVSPLRPLIEEELGEIPLFHHVGHDGQIFYAMALDLSGDTVGDLFIDPAYRYRRILYPTVASVFGILDGHALLIGMIVTTVLSAAFATGAVAAIGRLMGVTPLIALSVIVNPGIWLGIRLLTSETLAMALMCLGMMLFLMRRKSTHVAFSLSVLSKESFLMTPVGLGVSKNWRRWLVAVIPAAVLLIWSIWGQITMSGLTGESNNLSLPFVAFFQAAEIWPLGGFKDWFHLIFAMTLVFGSLIAGAMKRGWLRWSLLAWGALGVCSSWFVWRIGNNAARVFGPILILLVIHLYAPKGWNPWSTDTEDNSPQTADATRS